VSLQEGTTKESLGSVATYSKCPAKNDIIGFISLYDGSLSSLA